MPQRISAWFRSRVLSNTLSLSRSERWKASLGALLCVAGYGLLLLLLLLRSLTLDAHWLVALYKSIALGQASQTAKV